MCDLLNTTAPYYRPDMTCDLIFPELAFKTQIVTVVTRKEKLSNNFKDQCHVLERRVIMRHWILLGQCSKPAHQDVSKTTKGKTKN